MSPEVAALVGALIGAIAGVAGTLGAQILTVRAARRNRVAVLAAQLAGASYLVAYDARAKASGSREFVDNPRYQDAIVAASELAVLAPESVADSARDLANTMTSVIGEMKPSMTEQEWLAKMGEIRDARLAFIKTLRESKLRLVVQAGLGAVTASAIGIQLP